MTTGALCQGCSHTPSYTHRRPHPPQDSPHPPPMLVHPPRILHPPTHILPHLPPILPPSPPPPRSSPHPLHVLANGTGDRNSRCYGRHRGGAVVGTRTQVQQAATVANERVLGNTIVDVQATKAVHRRDRGCGMAVPFPILKMYEVKPHMAGVWEMGWHGCAAALAPTLGDEPRMV